MQGRAGDVAKWESACVAWKGPEFESPLPQKSVCVHVCLYVYIMCENGYICVCAEICTW